MVVIVLGAAGAGKTTIGRALAARHGSRFVDGDDYHTPEAIAKMRAGAALSDGERAPWLAALHAAVATASARREGLVVACSALKQRYRDVLRDDLRAIRFVYLKADESVLRQRLERRQGHFAGPALLASQLAVFEEPADAFTLTVDAARPPDDIVGAIDYEFGL
jgi:gluconokinase